MSNKSGTDVIQKPQGGGALKGIGDKFSPDLHTGTGNFTVPIELPGGRRGFQPALSLQYSSGSGNSPFGLGWSLNVPRITRKTDRGLPEYIDRRDTFVLSGNEDLVPVAATETTTRYRPRTEGSFSLIDHFTPNDGSADYWKIRTKDGVTSIYGTENSGAAARAATIHRPGRPERIFSWLLTETKDPFGNRISYSYERDTAPPEAAHAGDQLYLSSIQYVDYGDPQAPQYLFTVKFTYEDRPDSFSTYRSRFEIRTNRRCSAISIEVNTGDADTAIKVYRLQYLDQVLPAEHLPHNAVSLLRRITVEGRRRGESPESLPPLDFSYGAFQPERRSFFPLSGDYPRISLSDPAFELADLHGNALPDIVNIQNGALRYWRNLGQGRFAAQQLIESAPAGLTLADTGVQLIDADGDSRVDLLVTRPEISGYYPLSQQASFDIRSFRKYAYAPSIDLEDSEVKLVDLTGDGVTDAIRSGSSFECYFNDPKDGWLATRRIERRRIADFPNVNFSDARVKWGDVTGDGLTDILLIHNGRVDYWPALGFGDFAPRITMQNSPRFPAGYDPQRILIGDVDGDGAADIVYVDSGKVYLWINQSGRRWSDPVEIVGTPFVNDMDAVRLVDLLGNGVPGILWSTNAPGNQSDSMFFLDLTGGHKPYLLEKIDNSMGAITEVAYTPSTQFYLADVADELDWHTALPFPVQVVSRVATIDRISGGKMVSTYNYHHGHWDGADREYRGFGRVDKRDTETFADYHGPAQSSEDLFTAVEQVHFSPPVEARTWFHLGPVGPEYGAWQEQDFQREYWAGDAPEPTRDPETETLLGGLPRRDARDAIRSLRGRVIRSELYALDGKERSDRPFTVSEFAYGLREIDPPPDRESRQAIFFPYQIAKRDSQWERGNDPLTRLQFTGRYDTYGQPQLQLEVGVPRGRDWRVELNEDFHEVFLARRTATSYAQSAISDMHFIVDRVATVTEHQVFDNLKESAFQLWQRLLTDGSQAVPAADLKPKVIGQTLNYYDDQTNIGRVEQHGLLTRSEQLALTDAILQSVYAENIPPYLQAGDTDWTPKYPAAFREIGNRAGYIAHPADAQRLDGFYVQQLNNTYSSKGSITVQRDALNRATDIQYDAFELFPTQVTGPVITGSGNVRFTTRAAYDYEALKPQWVSDPNNNVTHYDYTPLSFVRSVALPGDTRRPSTRFTYNFRHFIDRQLPVYVQIERFVHYGTSDSSIENLQDSITSREYSNGYGRILQTRTQGENVRFGNPQFGGQILAPDQQAGPSNTVISGIENNTPDTPNVMVSGMQVYDNKGRVIIQYEPYYSGGWDYREPADLELGQYTVITYDPLGRQQHLRHSDGSEEWIVFGIPLNLDTPEQFEPTPWESYNYDTNDSGGRTPFATNAAHTPTGHHNTPVSRTIDALGRVIEEVERNGTNAITEWYRTRTHYDIQGNILKIYDALGRLAFHYSYDLLQQKLRTELLDGGTRNNVYDAAANNIEFSDGKGALALRRFDELNRTTRLWARDRAGEARTLRERIFYDGTGSGLPNPQSQNLFGQAYRHYDEAGLLRMESYDVKGNLLEKVRYVLSDDVLRTAFAPDNGNPITTFRVDWQAPTGTNFAAYAQSLLDSREYRTSTAYDALDRITQITYPEDVEQERRILLPTYNKAGTLKSLQLDGKEYVKHIAYNAKGQRTLIVLGNGLLTRYAYHPQNFRLTRLRTERYQPVDTYRYKTSGLPLQEYGYQYDLVGNLVGINDLVKGSGHGVKPDELQRSFSYDPLYRLLSATGRECRSLAAPRPWEEQPTCGYFPASLNQGNASRETAAYTERYEYDPAGNMIKMIHDHHAGRWVRHHGMGGLRPQDWDAAWRAHLNPGQEWHHPPGNQLTHLGDDNPAGRQSHHYDPNGNLIRETTSRHFEWDYADRLRAFYVSASGGSPSVHAHYLYDSSGRRIKKYVRKNGVEEVTIYIEDIFEYQSISGTAPTIKNTLYVMIDDRRLAERRIGTPIANDRTPAVKYVLTDHLNSSSLVVDDAGSWINREEYTPYGETTFGGYALKRYRFSGKEKDSESGLIMIGKRYYCTYCCRWTSTDPGGRIDGLNLFLYAKNSPLTFLDLTGYKALFGDPDAQPPAEKGTETPPVDGIQLHLMDADQLEVKELPDGTLEFKDKGRYIFGVGLEPAKESGDAVIADEDPGHAIYFVEDTHSGERVVGSFGPAKLTWHNQGQFLVGDGVPAKNDYHLIKGEELEVFKFQVSKLQFEKGKAFIENLNKHPGLYTPERQCVSVALEFSDHIGVELPPGESRVEIYIVSRLQVGKQLPNPNALSRELKATGLQPELARSRDFSDQLEIREPVGKMH